MHVERKIWRLHNQNLLCWSFDYISDNAKDGNQVPQLMKCHVCYFNLIIVANSRTKLRKGIISYLKHMEEQLFKNMWMKIMLCLQRNLKRK